MLRCHLIAATQECTTVCCYPKHGQLITWNQFLKKQLQGKIMNHNTTELH